MRYFECTFSSVNVCHSLGTLFQTSVHWSARNCTMRLPRSSPKTQTFVDKAEPGLKIEQAQEIFTRYRARSEEQQLTARSRMGGLYTTLSLRSSCEQVNELVWNVKAVHMVLNTIVWQWLMSINEWGAVSFAEASRVRSRPCAPKRLKKRWQSDDEKRLYSWCRWAGQILQKS